jgi:hypothetical protein
VSASWARFLLVLGSFGSFWARFVSTEHFLRVS